MTDSKLLAEQAKDFAERNHDRRTSKKNGLSRGYFAGYKEGFAAALASEEVRAMREDLNVLTECICDEAYKSRGMTDINCNHPYRDGVEAFDCLALEAK